MPAQSKYHEVCTNRADQRKYTTLPPNHNGNGKTYSKVWLRTKDSETAALRIRLLVTVGTEVFQKLLKVVVEYPKHSHDFPLVRHSETYRSHGIWNIEDERRLIEYLICCNTYRPDDRANIINQTQDGAFVIGIKRHDSKPVRQVVDDTTTVLQQLHEMGHHGQLRQYATMLQHFMPEDEANKPRPSKYKLSHCLKEWKEWAELDAKSAKHVKAYADPFNAFIAVVGDKPVNHLDKDDLLKIQKHLKAEQKQASPKTGFPRGPKWYIDQLRPIAAVLKHAKKVTSFPLPDPVGGWVDFKFPKYGKSPKKKNREPVSPEDFQTLMTTADEWASTDVESYAASLPKRKGRGAHLSDGNNIKQAYRRKRHGLLWRACLKLMAQASLDPIDIQRLTFDFITLDGKLPSFTLPRTKPQHEVGEPVGRQTPLLKSTVKAIREWREYYEKHECPRVKRQPSNYVFPSEHGEAWQSNPVSDSFKRLRDESGLVGFSVKHLRNIAATIRRNAGLPSDMSSAIQGHVISGMSAFYTGDHPDNWLLPLVKVIDKEYFGGK